MSHLAGLAASVWHYAEGVEGVLAVQSEEVAALADARNALHTRATQLADRHARILERQEALNHRFSELARRIYSGFLLVLGMLSKSPFSRMLLVASS